MAKESSKAEDLADLGKGVVKSAIKAWETMKSKAPMDIPESSERVVEAATQISNIYRKLSTQSTPNKFVEILL